MKIKKTCAVFYSGGKDGHFALINAVNSGYKISCIINIDGGTRHKSLFNDERKIPFLKKQTAIMGFPLFVYKAPKSFNPKNIVKCFPDIISSALKKYKFKSIFCGTTEDSGEYSALSELSEEIKLKIVMPIAKKNIFQIIKECEKLKIKPMISGVAKNVNGAWIGKIFDADVLEYIRQERKNGNFIDGNDFQTLVVSSPLFKKKLTKDMI